MTKLIHTIEIFSAGCALCNIAVHTVNKFAQSGSQIIVLDMHDRAVAKRV